MGLAVENWYLDLGLRTLGFGTRSFVRDLSLQSWGDVVAQSCLQC